VSPPFQEREEAGHAPPLTPHLCALPSQNLGFDNLYEPAVVVTEALRGADAVDGAREGMHALQQQYAATMSALRETAE